MQQLPLSSILRRPQVERLTGLSYTSIFRKEKNGDFPARVRLGPNAVGWKESDVIKWIESLKAVTNNEPVTKKAKL